MWDNHVSVTSRGAVLFQRFWDQYRTEVKQPFATPWSALNPARTPNGLADKEIAIRVFVDAVKWTRSTYGSESVAWGDVHRFRFKDIDLPADGATGTYGLFRVVSFRQQDDGKRVAGQVPGSDALVGTGDGWVLAVEFSQPVKAYSVLAYGQTTNSASPHSPSRNSTSRENEGSTRKGAPFLVPANEASGRGLDLLLAVRVQRIEQRPRRLALLVVVRIVQMTKAVE